MRLNYKCVLCDYTCVSQNVLNTHTTKVHKIDIKEYYDKYFKKPDEGICKQCGKPTRFRKFKDGYQPYCSLTCAAKSRIVDCSIQCKICEFTINANSKFNLAQKMNLHLKNSHNLTDQEYYNKYFMKPNEDKCVICGKPTKYVNLNVGYQTTCSVVCRQKNNNAISKQNFQLDKQIKEEIKTEEDNIKNYIQELKDRAHVFDWEGERNTVVCGNFSNKITDKNNILTDNSISYIDGQEYNSIGQTITKNECAEFDDVFWL